MRLTAEMYEQIAGKLKSDSQGNRDKRQEPRVGLPGEANLVSVDDAGRRIAGVARVRDVSQSGIGLIFNQQLAVKQRFVIQLKYANDQPLWLICSTAYCRAIDGGRFTVGARLVQTLHAQEVRLVEAKQAAAAKAAAAPVAVKKAVAVSASDVERISKAILG
jgi:hypothetical protein